MHVKIVISVMEENQAGKEENKYLAINLKFCIG